MVFAVVNMGTRLQKIYYPINKRTMENYRIYCEENERAEIMSILRKYNDVVIDNVNSTSFGITVERDDPETFYNNLLDEIDREVYAYRREKARLQDQREV